MIIVINGCRNLGIHFLYFEYIEKLKNNGIIKLGQIIKTVIRSVPHKIRLEALFMDSRKRMGKNKDGVIFPVAPNLSEMSDSYLDFIEESESENFSRAEG